MIKGFIRNQNFYLQMFFLLSKKTYNISELTNQFKKRKTQNKKNKKRACIAGSK